MTTSVVCLNGTAVYPLNVTNMTTTSPA